MVQEQWGVVLPVGLDFRFCPGKLEQMFARGRFARLVISRDNIRGKSRNGVACQKSFPPVPLTEIRRTAWREDGGIVLNASV